MTRFVPKEKMGKKARRTLDRRARVLWGFSPAAKTVESKKIYNRKRKTHDRDRESSGMGFFMSFPFAA